MNQIHINENQSVIEHKYNFNNGSSYIIRATITKLDNKKFNLKLNEIENIGDGKKFIYSDEGKFHLETSFFYNPTNDDILTFFSNIMENFGLAA